MPAELVDNAERSRYEYRDGAVLGTVDYRRAAGVTTLTFAHVPQALAGRGVGSAMARAVLEDLRARGELVVPVCGFIAAFIKRHPEFEELLARD